MEFTNQTIGYDICTLRYGNLSSRHHHGLDTHTLHYEMHFHSYESAFLDFLSAPLGVLAESAARAS